MIALLFIYLFIYYFYPHPLEVKIGLKCSQDVLSFLKFLTTITKNKT